MRDGADPPLPLPPPPRRGVHLQYSAAARPHVSVFITSHDLQLILLPLCLFSFSSLRGSPFLLVSRSPLRVSICKKCQRGSFWISAGRPCELESVERHHEKIEGGGVCLEDLKRRWKSHVAFAALFNNLITMPFKQPRLPRRWTDVAWNRMCFQTGSHFYPPNPLIGSRLWKQWAEKHVSPCGSQSSPLIHSFPFAVILLGSSDMCKNA